MSRIGKLPIIIPESVTVDISGQTVAVAGPKGTISYDLHDFMSVKIEDGRIIVAPKGNTRLHKSLYGLTRTLINNLVIGVTEGFTKQLEMKGVGYKAEVKERKLILSLGFSHPVEHEIPEGIEIEVKKNTIVISGIDKQLVGEVAAQIRRYRLPEPYKGKGIRYSNEVVRRKAGKAAKAAEGGGAK
jgi:large subunit ribosomal protein L6